MAGKIKGITVEIGANTTKLQEALKELNKPIKTASNELKEINRSLKFNPGNVDLLRQKQKLLNDQYTATETKLKALQQSMIKANADTSVDKTKEEYRQLERELIKVNNQLRYYAKEQAIAALEASKFGQINNTFVRLRPQIDSVANGFMKITKAAAGLSAALIAISLRRAFAKLETLEEVRAVFDGLGYSVEKVNDIMEATTKSVSGTKYAMADMAQVAKGAMGAGADQQYGLDNYLTRVADLAAFAGGDVSKFGTLLNKALSKGTIDARLLNSMLYAGIPIYNDLAAAMGVSQDELQKLIRAGKVGFDDLYRATEKYNGLAQELGMSTLGGAGTILAQTWGNIGVEFLQGAYEPLREGLTNLVRFLKGNMPVIKEYGKSFGEAISWLIDYAKTGSTSMVGLSANAKKMASALKPVVSVFRGIGQAIKDMPEGLKRTGLAVALLTGPALKLVSLFMGGYQALYKFVQILVKARAALTTAAAAESAYAVMQQAQTGATVAGTIAQRAFNKALLGNPAVMLVAGIVALTAALVALHIALKDTAGGYDQYRVSAKEVKDANKEISNSFDELESARDESIASGIGELKYYEQLKRELDGLVDANGQVKKGYEDRAQYIIGKLNDELNANITYANGVTNYNKQVKASIDEIIKAQKEKIVLQAYEQEYIEALKSEPEAIKNIESATKRVKDLEKDLQTARESGDYLAEQGYVQELEKANKERDKAVKNYQDLINKGKKLSDMQKAISEGDSAQIDKLATDIPIAYEELRKYTAEELEVMLEDQEAYKEAALQLWEETGDEQYKTMAEAYDENIHKTQMAMQDMARAMINNGTRVSSAMSSVMQAAKNAAGSVNFYSTGSNAVAGVIAGMNSSSAGLLSRTRQIIEAMKQAAEQQLGISSPSKVFAQIGAYTMEGLALGITDNADLVYSSLGTVADNMASGFTAMSTSGNMVTDISNAIGTGLAIANSGDRTPINANIVVELGGNKVGETIVSLYDQTSQQLYQGA